MLASSETPCPRKGIWETVDKHHRRLPFDRDDKLPLCPECGAATEWVLMQDKEAEYATIRSLR
jgi:hypothetical protein